MGLDANSARGAQAPCRRVAEVAHSLGMRAILAPSATALGETLAVFTDREFRAKVVEEEVWVRAPARSARGAANRDPGGAGERCALAD